MGYNINDFSNLKRGELIPCSCDNCGISFSRDRRNFPKEAKISKVKVYCCQKCTFIGNTKKIECKCLHCKKLFLKDSSDIIRSPNHFCSRSCSASYNNIGKIKSQETKGKLSLAARKNKNYLKNFKNYIHSSNPDLKETKSCPSCLKEFSSYKSQNKTFCCSKCFSLSGLRGGFRENSTRVTKCEYNGIKMDSGSEKDFARFLDELEIKWEKNTKIWFPYIFEGKNKKYYPDFFLEDLNLWVEIKGKYYVEKWLPEKIESVRNCGKQILLIFSSELKDKVYIRQILNL